MIQIQGLDNFLETLDDLVSPENTQRALNKVALFVEGEAKKKAPKGSGELRRSITSTVEDDKAIIFTPLEYAPYVEYGTGLFAEEGGRQDVPWHYKDDEGNWHSTSGMKPHPYMRPALHENIEKIKEIFKEEGLRND
jgi:HK97 gp10 family phage protein